MSRSIPLRSVQTIAVPAVTQLIGWGSTFDMLGVMGRVIAPDLGLPNEVVFGGLSIMMVVSALVGPATGRLLARHGAARVLAAASITFTIGLLLLSAAHGLVLYGLAWIAIGAGGAFGLSARILDMLLGRRGNPILSAAMGVSLMVSSFVMMLLIPPSTPLLVTFILLYGFGSGVMTVARTLLPLALFSPREFGLQSARLSLPQNLANAIAPVVFTAILDRAGAEPQSRHAPRSPSSRSASC